jgi:predicted acetyltransferase
MKYFEVICNSIRKWEVICLINRMPLVCIWSLEYSNMKIVSEMKKGCQVEQFMLIDLLIM